MYKIVLCLAIVGYVSSARLDNLQYLPPQGNSIQGSGQPGFAGKSGQPGGSYTGDQSLSAPQGPSSPQQQYNQPSNQYGAPSGPAGSGQQFAPQPKSPLNDVPILRLDTENTGDGNYRYAYETGNDIAAQEEGTAVSGWNQAQGGFRFTSPEGQTFEISYTADKNGYVPQGAHLPTPPPIPEEILKSLELIRQAEASGKVLEGAYQPEGDDGQYRESHDDGQYNPQQYGGNFQHSGGYQQGGYQQSSGGYQESSGGYNVGVDVAKNAPQGHSQQNYQGQQTGQQQSAASNGGYRY